MCIRDRAGTVLLGVIPCVFLLPLLAPLVVVLAVLVYLKESQKADEKRKAKREEIERELPRLAATIEQELKAGRNVIGMLERYQKNAGPALKGELDILLADMRSSNYEAALTRFEARLNSPMLSDVVRGLIGVLRGDDSAVYFQMLSHDFKQLEMCIRDRPGAAFLLPGGQQSGYRGVFPGSGFFGGRGEIPDRTEESHGNPKAGTAAGGRKAAAVPDPAV